MAILKVSLVWKSVWLALLFVISKHVLGGFPVPDPALGSGGPDGPHP